ncbi:hypothetical protein VDGL01_07636 [Verticillium dahliae]
MGLPAAARMEHTAPQRNATQQRSARRNATCSSATERQVAAVGKQPGEAAHTCLIPLLAPLPSPNPVSLPLPQRSLTLPRLVTDAMLVLECVACLALLAPTPTSTPMPDAPPPPLLLLPWRLSARVSWSKSSSEGREKGQGPRAPDRLWQRDMTGAAALRKGFVIGSTEISDEPFSFSQTRFTRARKPTRRSS